MDFCLQFSDGDELSLSLYIILYVIHGVSVSLWLCYSCGVKGCVRMSAFPRATHMCVNCERNRHKRNNTINSIPNWRLIVYM